VGTKAALILGGGGITGGMYEPEALSAHEFRGTRSFPELRLQLLGVLLHQKFQ
jgi:hypothetical protein